MLTPSHYRGGGEYLFPADCAGKILTDVCTRVRVVVAQGNKPLTDFTIGAVVKPCDYRITYLA